MNKHISALNNDGIIDGYHDNDFRMNTNNTSSKTQIQKAYIGYRKELCRCLMHDASL